MRPRSVPSRIDRYEIKSIIGAGGMGTLYLARDTNPNTARLVALKLLNANIDSEEFRQRFGREARALAALNHPNVVNIYDSGEYQFAPYMVMEYVRGETLAEKIKRRATLSLTEKLKLMMELCAGLGHAHEAGIIHRDIKPANVMVDRSGRVKLLDFGIARSEGAMLTMFGPQMTRFNVRIGTPGYMSPEQIDGGEVDRRSDIFAVGAVMYELLSYCEAFSGSTTREIEDKVMQSDPPPLKSYFIPGMTAEIEAIVARALAKDPADRFQDAFEMERALERQRWALGPTDTGTTPARVTPLPGASRKRESAAEIAFQRAQQCYDQDAVEAAKRFALEALAEDPRHARARALLEELDPRAWVAMPENAATSESPRDPAAEGRGPTPPRVSDPFAVRQDVRPPAPAGGPLPFTDPTALRGDSALGGETALAAGTAVGGGTALGSNSPLGSDSTFDRTVLGAGGLAPEVPATTNQNRFSEPLPDATFVLPAGAFAQQASTTPPAARIDRPASPFDEPASDATFVSPLPPSYAAPVPDATPERRPFKVPTPGRPPSSGSRAAYVPPPEDRTFVGPVPSYDDPVPEATSFAVRTPQSPMLSEDMTMLGAPVGWDAQPDAPLTPAAAPFFPSEPARPSSPPASPKAAPAVQARMPEGRAPGAGKAAKPAAKKQAPKAPLMARLGLAGGWQNPQVKIGAAVVAVLLVVVALTAVVVRWILAPPAPGFILTIQQPAGGTITAEDINCGARAADCTARFDSGAAIELAASPEPGYIFAGYTGDCAPTNGRVLMSEARTCGAQFAPDPSSVGSGPGPGSPGPVTGPVTPGGPAVLLQLVPPAGGTIIGPGIKCGTMGKDCARTFEPNAVVKLEAWADRGFTFRGFTGDCPQEGESLMNAPKTCGATFTSETIAVGPSAGGGTPPGGTVGRGQAPPSGGGGTRPGTPGSGVTPAPPSGGAGAGAAGAGAAGAGGAAAGAGGAPGAPGSGAPSGVPNAPAFERDKPVEPPPPPPPPSLEKLAKDAIEKALETYRESYVERDYAGIKVVYPTAPQTFVQQFRQYSKIDFTYGGPPKYVSLDPRAGSALVEVQTTFAGARTVGGADKRAGAMLFSFLKRGADDDWVIVNTRVK
jgi:hypothetical protein